MSQALYTSSTHTAVRGKSINTQIFRALLSLASAALLIRVMGMVYQIVVTSRFGEGAAMDAYFVASSIPLLLASLIVAAIEYSVIPVYARMRAQGNTEQASELFSTLLNLFLIGSLLLTAALFVFRQQMVFFAAPTLDSVRMGLAFDLTPFIIPVLLLQIVLGFLESILNAEGQFGWPAYAGLLVPLTTALFVLVAGKSYGVVMLCVGMVVGLCIQFCVFLVRVKQAKLVYRPVLKIHMPEIGLILVAAGPAFLGGVMTQISPLVDQIFASLLSAGSISALNYSLKIVGVFTGVLFGSTARALLPHLSRQSSAQNLQGFKQTLRLYLWLITMSTTLLAVFVIVLAHPLVQILFQRGAFTAEATSHTASTLIGFSIGLAPMAFGFIASRALSALNKNHLLLCVTIFSVCANALFDYIFARIWQAEGIALATSAVYFCTMCILLLLLRRTLGKLDLLTPPPEIRLAVHKFLQHKENLFDLSYELQRYMLRIGVVLSVFAAGVVGVLLNASYTLRIALGSVVILALLRYRYVLLLVWVLYVVVVRANPLLAGSNVLTGLIVPTLLLMTYLPVKQTLKRMPALIGLLVYLLWVLLSINLSPLGITAAVTNWMIYLAYVAIAVIVINEVTTPRRLSWLADVMLLSAGFIALYGIFGYLTKRNGLTDPTVGFRILSIFHSAPSLALYLSLVIPLAFYRVLTTQGLRRICCILLIPTLLLALVLTFTRGALISVPMSILIMIFFLPSRKMKKQLFGGLGGLAVLTVLLATIGNVPILSRFFNQDLATLNGRTYIWQAILSHFDPTQLLGKGLDASDVLLTNLQVSASTHGVIATAPHNLLLGTLYDHGLIGAVLLTLVFVLLLVGLLKGIRTSNGDRRMLFVMSLAVLVNMFIQSLDSSDFWIEDFAIYFWIIMALPFALGWSTPQTKRLPETHEETFIDEEATEPRLPKVQPPAQKQALLV